MSMKRLANIICSILIGSIACSVLIFSGAHFDDIRLGESDALTLSLYCLSYAMVISVLVLYIIAFKKADTRKRKLLAVALAIILVNMIIRTVFDIFTYAEDGNVLDGAFTMMTFLFLDVLLVALYVVSLLSYVKKRKSIWTKTVNVLIVVALLVYSLGELLGYPLKTFTDWDEFQMMFAYVIVGIISLSPSA